MKRLRTFFVLLILPFFLLITFVVLAQEKKEPAATVTSEFFKAPEKFDKVDRNKDKIFDGLEEQITGKADGDRFDVIVMLSKPLVETSPSALKSKHGDFEEKFTYPSINGFATNLSKGQITTLSQDANIKQIEFDAPVYPHLDTSQQWFGTTKARNDFGVDGNADGSASYSKNDIVIAVIDSGIDTAHVDLDGGKVIGWKDFATNHTIPYDEVAGCSGHGTHVSSIAAGEGQADANFKGVAPGAALVGVKVLKRQGNDCVGTTSNVNAGIQWVIDNKTTLGIKVANMSLGVDGCSNGTDSTSVAVNAAVDAGIVMTVSAGNEGPGTCTIGSPAAAEKAITVGAMADVTPAGGGASTSCGPLPYRGFYLACFSSRGLTADGRTKPDIASPGVFITAALAGTTNGYQSLSGTSMSSPFTAGVAALMLDANPSLTPTQVKSTIENNALNWGPGGKDIDYGSGRLQAYEAIRSVGSFSGNGPTVPTHTFVSDSLTGTGNQDTFSINVTDTSKPLAVTLIITSLSGGSPDFDLELRDASGNPLFSCSGGPSSTSPCICTTDPNGICKSRGVTRQETVGFQPPATGTYQVRVVSFSGSGNYFFDTSFGEAAVAISLTTDGTTPFGIVALGAAKDTTPTGTNDVQTVQVTTGPANLSVKSTTFSDGINTWALGVGSGANQVRWEFSKDTSAWTTFTTANTLFTFDNNIAQGANRNLYLRLTMPSSTTSTNQHSAVATIVATAP